MEPVAKLLKGNRTGWDLVRHHMDAQLESGKTTHQDWADELNGVPHQAWVLAKPEDPTSKLLPICTVNPSKEFSPLEQNPGRTRTPVLYERPRRMESWNLYLWWRDNGPAPMPSWVVAMRSDEELAAFAGYCYGAMLAAAALGVPICCGDSR